MSQIITKLRTNSMIEKSSKEDQFRPTIPSSTTKTLIQALSQNQDLTIVLQHEDLFRSSFAQGKVIIPTEIMLDIFRSIDYNKNLVMKLDQEIKRY
ncbi:hypothetical protein pb186bvf_014097 [Paramecium bursaria]